MVPFLLPRPTNRSGPRLVWAGVVGLLLLITFLTLSATPVSAKGVSHSHDSGPDWIWDVQTPGESNHTNNIRALVHDLVEHDGRIYAGGKFLEAVSPTGERVSRPYLAAFDIATGALDRDFTPQLDGAVYTVAETPDGQLIVGGEFSGGIAVLDPATGAKLNTFPATVSLSWGHAVWDIEFFDGAAFVGGYFERANGQPRDNLAKFAYPSGALDASWTTGTQGIDDGTRLSNNPMVWGMDIDEDRNRLFLAGKFDAVNNDAAIDNFAILDTNTGALVNSVPQSDPVGALNHDGCAPDDPSCWHIDNWYYDVVFDDEMDLVYLGGQAHTTIRLRGADLEVLDTTLTNKGLNDTSAGGDTQVIAIGKTTVWSGCHCFGSVTRFEKFDHEVFGGEYRDIIDEMGVTPHQSVRGAYGQNRSTGEVTPQVFDTTGQSGAWALLEDSFGRLWSGGLWESGGGRSLSGLARFTPVGGVKPVAPASCTAALVDGNIEISWTRAGNDLATGFVVRRSRNGGARFWRTMTAVPATSFTDNGVAVGSSYGFTVETVSGTAASGPRACIPTPILVTADDDTPKAPTSCTATLVGSDVRITWTAVANDNATDYIVRRSRNAGAFYWASRNPQPASQWTDTRVVADSSYSYTVETRSGTTASNPTTCSPSQLTVTPDLGSPIAPTTCSMTTVGGNPVLTWTDHPSDPGNETVVRRRRNGGTYYWAVKRTDPTSTWTDTNTQAQFIYEYTVESRLNGLSSATRTNCN